MENKNNAYLYLHRRLDTNEVFYVGIGTEKNFKRAFVKAKNKRNSFWSNIVNKVNYAVDIIYKNISWEQACKYEMNFIAMYGRKDLGLGNLVNMTNGGDGNPGKIISEKQKYQISKAHKNKTVTKETREKLREFNLGKKHNKETKLKISLGNKGRIVSEETKEKLRNFHKGNLNTVLINQNIAKKRKGLPNIRSKIYLNLETGIFHYSLSEAANAYNIKLVTLQKRVIAKKGKIISI